MSSGVPKTRAEVKDLQRLRKLFLDAPEHSGVSDYWSDHGLLELYDATFARRIGWKWEAVLADLSDKGWSPAPALKRWVDWGCGSGVASECFMHAFEPHLPAQCVVSDRSIRAREFTRQKLSSLNPSLHLESAPAEQLSFHESDLILLSHVLTELTEKQLNDLIAQLSEAGTLLWIEPGTPFCSQRLIQVRQALQDRFRIVAPCTHQKPCGLAKNERDWCHFFASPPKDIFQDSDIIQFAKVMQIDLRSLPVSYLVLENKRLRTVDSATEDKVRAIGRPRFYKGHAKILFCGKDGVKERSLQERHYKKEFKAWDRDAFSIEITSAVDSD